MPETVDEILIAFYREMSSGLRQFQGLSVLEHDEHLRKIIKVTGAKTLLDYGSGLGYQYTKHNLHDSWGVPMPTLYDPGVVGLDVKPEGKFDGVICNDVLEHVPERLIDNVLAEVFGYAQLFVWLSVCCRPAKKNFPDGTNLHVTVKEEEWWQRKVSSHQGEMRTALIFTP